MNKLYRGISSLNWTDYCFVKVLPLLRPSSFASIAFDYLLILFLIAVPMLLRINFYVYFSISASFSPLDWILIFNSAFYQKGFRSYGPIFVLLPLLVTSSMKISFSNLSIFSVFCLLTGDAFISTWSLILKFLSLPPSFTLYCFQSSSPSLVGIYFLMLMSSSGLINEGISLTYWEF